MFSENELKATIPGSFHKFKPEIDRAIDEFTDLGVTILAPGKGWLYKPPYRSFDKKSGFRPLPSEIGMTIKQIEDGFLAAIEESDFVYVVNPDGFIGETVAFEIGFAFGKGIPVYCQKPIPTLFELDPLWAEIVSSVKHLTPEEIVEEVGNKSQQRL